MMKPSEIHAILASVKNEQISIDEGIHLITEALQTAHTEGRLEACNEHINLLKRL